jgi:hypothetical protein
MHRIRNAMEKKYIYIYMEALFFVCVPQHLKVKLTNKNKMLTYIIELY